MSSTLFSCNYPLYTVGRLDDNDTEFYVAGGGGQAKTGVPNSLVSGSVRCVIRRATPTFYGPPTQWLYVGREVVLVLSYVVLNHTSTVCSCTLLLHMYIVCTVYTYIYVHVERSV